MIETQQKVNLGQVRLFILTKTHDQDWFLSAARLSVVSVVPCDDQALALELINLEMNRKGFPPAQ